MKMKCKAKSQKVYLQVYVCRYLFTKFVIYTPMFLTSNFKLLLVVIYVAHFYTYVYRFSTLKNIKLSV